MQSILKELIESSQNECVLCDPQSFAIIATSKHFDKQFKFTQSGKITKYLFDHHESALISEQLHTQKKDTYHFRIKTSLLEQILPFSLYCIGDFSLIVFKEVFDSSTQSFSLASNQPAKVRTSSSHFTDFIEKSNIMFMRLNRLGLVTEYINAQSVLISKNFTKSSRFQDYFGPELSQKIWQHILVTKIDNNSETFEYTCSTEGDDRWFEIQISPLENSETILTARDITDSKLKGQLEIENDRLSTLGVLSGGLAHQFNNIHNVILGNLEILQFIKDDKEEFERSLKTIHHYINKASSITKRLLDFSKTKKKGFRSLNIVEVINNSFDFTEELFLKSHVKFEVIDQNTEQFFCKVDPALLEQVFINLFINAIQAMESITNQQQRKLTIKIFSSQTSEDIICDISDTGPGVPRKFEKKIFTPLFTTKNTGDEKRGSGLGLSLSLRIVQDLGGRLTLRPSIMDKGATFRLRFPISGKKLKSIEISGTQELNRIDIKNLNIAIIDDEAENRVILTNFIKLCCHESTQINEWSDGNINHDELLAFAPDIILLDWIMKDKNADFFLEKLKLTQGDYLKKVIIISGHIPENKDLILKEYPGLIILNKPFTLNKLCSAIQLKTSI